MLNKFISYKDWLNEEFVEYAKLLNQFSNQRETYEIIKNPTPNEVPSLIRAIADNNGDLWCAVYVKTKEDYGIEDFATHLEIVAMINKLNVRDYITLPYNYGADYKGETIALQRLGNTNIFALGESYYGPDITKINKEIWNKLIKKQKSWKFVFKKITRMEEIDIKQKEEA